MSGGLNLIKRTMGKKKITDFTVVRSIMTLQRDIFSIFNNTPKKFRYNIEQEVKDSVSNALRLVVKSMDTPQLDSYMMQMKRDYLLEAHSELRVLEVNLCQLNDMCALSNEAKAKLDISLYDIYGNITRLVNSLIRHISESENGCYDNHPELGVIGMPNCGMEK